MIALLMFITVCLFLLSGFPVAFTLAGISLLFALIGSYFGLFDLSYIFFLKERIFGIATNEVLIAVPLFVFMGITLEKSKVAEELLQSMEHIFGSVKGGLGISVIFVGALLAASTGIVGATVITMGLLSLPSMLKKGYSPELSTGTICASGTLGQIIPPSIVLILLGDQISNAYQDALRTKQSQLWAQGIYDQPVTIEPISVGHLFAGSLIPGLILVLFYMIYFLYKSSREQIEPPKQNGSINWLIVVETIFPPMLLIFAVLGSILCGVAAPTEAASVGAVGALLLAGYKLFPHHKKLYLTAFYSIIGLVILRQFDSTNHYLLNNFFLFLKIGLSVFLFGIIAKSIFSLHKRKILQNIMANTMTMTSMVFAILIGASLFSLVFRGYGGDDYLHLLLSDIYGGKIMAIFIIMLTLFILGFFLDFIEIIFVVVPIVTPILVLLDVNPLWLGVMIALNLQTSFLTPPFGFSLFYLKSVAPKSIKTLQIYKGVIPFIAIQMVTLLLLCVFPQLATWLPEQIFN